MKILARLVGGLLVLVVALLGVAAVVLSYDASCPPDSPIAAGDSSMQAVSYGCYGPPEVLRVGQVARPAPGPGEVLVKVKAAAVNPMDWHYMRGSPYFMRLMSGIGRPGDTRLGTDFAGVVEAVGEEVTEFKAGDAVFGGAAGAFSEYLVRAADRSVTHIPEGASFAEAAALPIAGITALQALRDKGQLKPGERVLINGASGGVGSFAVQIGKSMGATVTGVCSTRNLERVQALGADHVIDYKRSDYTSGEAQFDLIVDTVGNHSVWANSRVLAPGGRLVMVAGGHGDWLGPLENSLMAMLLAPFVEHSFITLLARLEKGDLEALAQLAAEGKLRSSIDRHYPLSEVAEAIAYSESGRARGKIILDLE